MHRALDQAVGVDCGTYGHRWGQHFNGHSEWGFVFLTLEIGLRTSPTSLTKHQLKICFLTWQQQDRRRAFGALKGFSETARAHDLPELFLRLWLTHCALTHIASVLPLSSRVPC